MRIAFIDSNFQVAAVVENTAFLAFRHISIRGGDLADMFPLSEFDIEIPDEEAEKITTVQSAIDYVQNNQ